MAKTVILQTSVEPVKLLKNGIKQVVSPEYFRTMTRAAIRAIFRSKVPSLTAQFFGHQLNHGTVVCHTTAYIYRLQKRLEIGCTAFAGKNYTALRKWALSK